MATTIDTQFIVTEYGNIYEKNGQNLDRIKRALLQSAVTEKFATHKRIDDDVYKMANDTFRSVLQPFRHSFEPIGGVDFFPNKIELQHIKVDVCLNPDAIIDSWLGFLEGPNVDRKQWPITKYIVEVYLKQQIDYDREMYAIYKGVRDDDGTTPSSCMDGIKQKLIEGSTGNNAINVISGIGALDETTFFDQVEAFSKKISPVYQNQPIIICVPQNYKRAYLEGKRANGWYWLNGPEDINSSVDFTKQVVMGLPAMNGTSDMFAFVKGNLLWLTRKDKFNFDLQKSNRDVNILADWREGIGFGCNKMVWATSETVAVQSANPETGEDQSANPETGEDQSTNPETGEGQGE